MSRELKIIRLLEEISDKLDRDYQTRYPFPDVVPMHSCKKCRMPLVDSNGRPLVLGYSCIDPECPCGLGGVQC